MSPSNLRFDVQCEWVNLRYDPPFHVSSPPTLAIVLPPECQRVFEGDVARYHAVARVLKGSTRSHELTANLFALFRGSLFVWELSQVCRRSGDGRFLINDNDERHMTMPIRTEPPLN